MVVKPVVVLLAILPPVQSFVVVTVRVLVLLDVRTVVELIVNPTV